MQRLKLAREQQIDVHIRQIEVIRHLRTEDMGIHFCCQRIVDIDIGVQAHRIVHEMRELMREQLPDVFGVDTSTTSTASFNCSIDDIVDVFGGIQIPMFGFNRHDIGGMDVVKPVINHVGQNESRQFHCGDKPRHRVCRIDGAQHHSLCVAHCACVDVDDRCHRRRGRAWHIIGCEGINRRGRLGCRVGHGYEFDIVANLHIGRCFVFVRSVLGFPDNRLHDVKACHKIDIVCYTVFVDDIGRDKLCRAGIIKIERLGRVQVFDDILCHD